MRVHSLGNFVPLHLHFRCHCHYLLTLRVRLDLLCLLPPFVSNQIQTDIWSRNKLRHRREETSWREQRDQPLVFCPNPCYTRPNGSLFLPFFQLPYQAHPTGARSSPLCHLIMVEKNVKTCKKFKKFAVNSMTYLLPLKNLTLLRNYPKAIHLRHAHNQSSNLAAFVLCS